MENNRNTIVSAAGVIGQANALQLPLANDSVRCVVTSPPYWNLRVYSGNQAFQWQDGSVSALGLEEYIEEYVKHMVYVFREIRRVLHPTGTVWLVIGDRYINTGKYGSANIKLKNKDLAGVPWRVAFALQEDGWYLRSDIVWYKPNAMPSSIADRPTKSHEYVFLLAKLPRYFYDHIAVLEPCDGPINRWGGDKQNSDTRKGRYYRDNLLAVGKTSALRPGASLRPNEQGRNRRTVWSIPTEIYPRQHFAVFPRKLVELCLSAGTSARGVCSRCGAPWRRMLSREKPYNRSGELRRRAHRERTGRMDGFTPPGGYQDISRTVGWTPTCECNSDVVPSMVLDPFCGSGTVALVAAAMGRRFACFDLSYEYCAMSMDRMRDKYPLFYSE